MEKHLLQGKKLIFLISSAFCAYYLFRKYKKKVRNEEEKVKNVLLIGLGDCENILLKNQLYFAYSNNYGCITEAMSEDISIKIITLNNIPQDPEYEYKIWEIPEVYLSERLWAKHMKNLRTKLIIFTVDSSNLRDTINSGYCLDWLLWKFPQLQDVPILIVATKHDILKASLLNAIKSVFEAYMMRWSINMDVIGCQTRPEEHQIYDSVENVMRKIVSMTSN